MAIVARSPLGPATPLHAAALAGDSVALERLLEARTLDWALNVRDAGGQAPLHWAVLGGYVDCVAALLRFGADPNLVDGNGVSPVWTAEDDFGMHTVAALLRSAGGTK